MALEALRPVDPFHKEDIISLVQQFIMDDSSETSYQPISEYKLSQKPYDASVGGRTETTATKDSTDSESGSEASATYSTPKTSLAPSSPRRRSSSDKDAFLLSYQLHANGPILSISEKDRRRAYLPTNISQLYGKVLQTDSLVHAKCQDFKTNGIHIFLDMSNVYISFLNTIKERLQLPPGARFPKNPHLNLRRLTKLITRSRLVATRVAGCSVIPDRSEPVFVEHLRNYDYRVDVRERKAVQSSNQTGASPPKRSYSPKGVRYVEDLVDETLQTRIGETFMKSGHKKATLILVTGDAKPAPYADGFGECAKRALGWGWNVEVVNWSTSCSSIWRDMARDESYGNQFRLIDLDHYLKYLWTDEE
ncbi:Conserved hypothetical, protein [Geosmithia morbida]|uniref:Conserved hypothetical, protein n=1 Tax=Geosmithia morbida TaxID=1094350 RepID=A0A9P4YR72_9HYPO|nr:Conserved hypothetical, protein [Geosmithia morbida]KAF4121611.1 Conserved hypothetical, protein [Geosmithia morbida]